MQWSQYQNAILAHAADPNAGSLLIEAVAGSGKTTIIVECSKVAPESFQLFLAFNKRIVEELTERFPPSDSRVIKTLNALGHGAWSSFIKQRLNVSSKKSYSISMELAPKLKKADRKALNDLVAGAKTFGLVPKGARGMNTPIYEDCPESWQVIIDHYRIESPNVELARACLLESINQAFQGVIDFNDQIYMSALWTASFTKYPLVFVDEAQDLNGLQHKILRKVLAPKGRLIAAGDRCQAIYGFRGALPRSMDILSDRFGMAELPLSVSYRCPKAVVAEAQKIVSHIEPHEDAPLGSVEDLEFSDVGLSMFASEQSAAILCRTNAPLLDLAWQLFEARIPAHFMGRELESQMLTLLDKISGNRNLDKPALENSITRWLAKECEKNPKMKDRLREKAANLRAIIKHATDTVSTKHIIESLFSVENARVTLCTVHKAKGLEWPAVYIWRPDLMPHPNASGEYELDQENNMKYVAVTRSQDRLYFVYSAEEEY
jgi:superfamily I DNA/RNA helicase